MTTVRYELQGNIAVVTLDDGKANALSYALMDEADQALTRAEHEAGAVVLTGRAGRFSAGFDLREMMSGADKARALVSRGAEFLLRLYALPMPLVIACSGHALAGGALMVLTGDVRIGADGPFKIGLNEVQLGMPIPILAMELARARLKSEYLTRATLLAEVADPKTALEWGYVDEVVAADATVTTAIAHATKLAALSRDAYAKSKMAMRERTIRYIKDTLTDDLQRLTPPATA
jgi:enoyl-CoA hydratase